MQRPLTTTWCTRLLLPLGLAASVAGNALAQQPGVAPAWSVTNLGTLGGAETYFNDFNNHGQVVGTAVDLPETGERRAFFYDAGRMTAIPPLPGLRFNDGWRINDRGQVIGFGWDDAGIRRGFLYSGGQLTPLMAPGATSTGPVGINARGDVLLAGSTTPEFRNNFGGYIYSNGTYNNIGTLGGPSTFPGFINDRGQVTGESQLANGEFQGFFYSEGRMVPLATTGVASPNALNNAGQVAGSYNGSAAIFHEGQITSLGNLGGRRSGLNDINDAGEAIGTINYSVPEDRFPEEHAFGFSDGQVQDLHNIFSYAGAQLHSTVALDINELGQVLVAADFFLGAPRIFLWDDGRVTDLSTVLEEVGVSVGPNSRPALNDVGQVMFQIGFGFGIVTTPYLVTPIPEPSTYALMLAGLGTLAFLTWRRHKPIHS